MGKNVLVAYFSASGVTKKAAEKIAKAVDGDIFEIAPVTPYTTADLDWTNKKSRSTVEMEDPNCRPPFKGSVENISQYDTVFVGFPIWWYVEPKIIDTFLDSCDFSGKAVIPFATSGGSTINSTFKNLQKSYPNINWQSPQLLNSIDIAKWATSVISK